MTQMEKNETWRSDTNLKFEREIMNIVTYDEKYKH